MTNYKVVLKSIKLFGYHGVLKEEQEKGQEFTFDVKYKYQKKDEADDIKAAVDYSEVFSLTKSTFEAKRYNLLENLAQDIAKAIISGFPAISKVKVSVWKSNPPVGGKVGSVGVTAKAKS